MSPKITNLSQVHAIMEKRAIKMLKSASKEILTEFLKYIDRDVYGWGSPKEYKRTYDFKKAWKWSAIRRVSSALEMVMFGDYSTMRSVADLFQHSSYTPFGQDSRFFLESVLNHDAKVPDKEWLRVKGEPFWKNFIEEMYDTGKLLKIINRHAKENGFLPSRVSISK